MIEGARPNGIVRRDREYVCTEALRCLGRTYEKGQVFPHRRYRCHAPRLKRKGLIVEKGLSPVIEVEKDPGEAPFGSRHRGHGCWAIVNAAGEVISSTSTKVSIEALVEQMNAVVAPIASKNPTTLDASADQEPDADKDADPAVDQELCAE